MTEIQKKVGLRGKWGPKSRIFLSPNKIPRDPCKIPAEIKNSQGQKSTTKSTTKLKVSFFFASSVFFLQTLHFFCWFVSLGGKNADDPPKYTPCCTNVAKQKVFSEQVKFCLSPLQQHAWRNLHATSVFVFVCVLWIYLFLLFSCVAFWRPMLRPPSDWLVFWRVVTPSGGW